MTSIQYNKNYEVWAQMIVVIDIKF